MALLWWLNATMRAFIGLSSIAVLGVALCAQTAGVPVGAVPDPGVVTTRQTITPAGVPAVFQGRVHGVAFGSTSGELWVLNNNLLLRFDWQSNRVTGRFETGGRPGPQSLVWDPVAARPLLALARRVPREPHRVELASPSNGSLATVAARLGTHQNGAPAVARRKDPRGRRLAAVPLTYDNKLALVDLETGKFELSAVTGIAPFGVVLNEDGTVAWVSNWGGRLPKPGELTAPTGTSPKADRVVIDSRGIASTGTVTRVDLSTGEATAFVKVGLHPTGLVWDEPRQRLYVANGNADSVSVIDTNRARLLATYPIQPFSRTVRGVAPLALAVSPDGATLYAACGGINAIAVLDAHSGKLSGTIPTAWYPSSLSLSADGKRLAVGALLGAGSAWRDEPRKKYVHSYRGAVSVIDLPDAAGLQRHTLAVAANNLLPPAGTPVEDLRPRRGTAPRAIPQRAGEPSLIEHVVYIVKENRTYDQVLGDLDKGNRDPSLVMFGREVTPNTHKLAEEFVVLDNFYATGGNSANGHQWVTQANETSYTLWPGYEGRSYPYDGTDPIAYSQGGFLWDEALKRGRTVRVYGEFVSGAVPGLSEARPEARVELLKRWQQGEDFSGRWTMTSNIPPLDKLLNRNYPGYNNIIPDVARAQIFLKDLKEWERTGKMPNLVIMLLSCDHTMGTTPGASTPKAMVADNDLALGQVVEGLSRSQFWKKMAILVVEDDAQNGVDHVDGHRTVALAVSPYTRRRSVDSTFYSHQSMVKTIELILGLPHLSLFDMIASDMGPSFQDTPDFTAYTAESPGQDLFEVNPPLKALQGPARQAARDSARMKWSEPDAAPTERLNRILWGQIMGWDKAYPAPPRMVFAPLSLEIEDEERELRGGDRR
jgi:DNA-binding beta-propeller fold protein YncE